MRKWLRFLRSWIRVTAKMYQGWKKVTVEEGKDWRCLSFTIGIRRWPTPEIRDEYVRTGKPIPVLKEIRYYEFTEETKVWLAN